jgi:hypothetical protein
VGFVPKSHAFSLAKDLQLQSLGMKYVFKSWLKGFVSSSGLALCILPVLAGCGDADNFSASSRTETFVQDYNPDYLEVLWMVDDRSPMRRYQSRLVSEAQTLFSRLDASVGQYGQTKVGVTSTDGRDGKIGLMKPIGSPTLITTGMGSFSERVALFGNVLFPLINLLTDANNHGIAASIQALRTSPFSSDPRVPLVLVYLSYGDDKSPVPAGTADPIEYFAQSLLSLKNGKQDLVRVYAANYLPLPAGVLPSEATRCAKDTDNEIDISPATYQDRYFRLAQRLGGKTADLCAPGFAAGLDLNGVKLKTLPSSYALQGNPKPDTLQVSFTYQGKVVSGPDFTYDAATRTLNFDETPAEGLTIVVTYLPRSL